MMVGSIQLQRSGQHPRMNVDIYWIPSAPGPPLGIMPRPRGGDWLEDEIHFLRSHGVDVLVSLLGAGEVKELDLADEEAACRTLGLHFLSFPTLDRSIPDSTPAAPDFARSLKCCLRSGLSKCCYIIDSDLGCDHGRDTPLRDSEACFRLFGSSGASNRSCPCL